MNTEAAPAKTAHEPDEKYIEVAKKTMTGDLRDVCLEIIRDPKLTGKAWKDMKEHEQRDVVDRIVRRVEYAVARSHDIIATSGQPHVKALLKQVVFKDGIKAVFECSKDHDLRHELADAQGDTILIVLCATDEFQGERAKVKIDKDQKELPVTEKENKDGEDNEEDDFDPETGEIDDGEEAAEGEETDDQDDAEEEGDTDGEEGEDGDETD